MKKGFLKILLLLILRDEPYHGYKIIKEIEKRSLGVFNPSTSSIYPILSSLQEKKLIECIDKQKKGRKKKVYQLTEDGLDTLNKLIKRQQRIVKSITSIIYSTLDISKDFKFSEIDEIFPKYPLLELLVTGEIGKEKEQLTWMISFIESRITTLQNFLQRIKKELKSFE
jgi:DNA-binding PadR family transcriptional regulator